LKDWQIVKQSLKEENANYFLIWEFYVEFFAINNSSDFIFGLF